VTSTRSDYRCKLSNPSIKIISCAGFEKWKWDTLEEQNQISDGQLNKLAQINIILQQIQSYFREHFWKELPTSIFFWDYWIRVKNPEVLDIQYEINKSACENIFNKEKIGFSNLSECLEKQSYTQSGIYDPSLVKEHMLKNGLSEQFIYWYLKSSLHRPENELKIIWMSIEEHINLTHQIIKHRDNSLLIYIGNTKKITLMNEIIKTNKHSNILIWIHT